MVETPDKHSSVYVNSKEKGVGGDPNTLHEQGEGATMGKERGTGGEDWLQAKYTDVYENAIVKPIIL